MTTSDDVLETDVSLEEDFESRYLRIRPDGYTPDTRGPANERPLVTTVKVEVTPRHYHLTIYSRGVHAGTMSVLNRDGEDMVLRQFGKTDFSSLIIEPFDRDSPGA